MKRLFALLMLLSAVPVMGGAFEPDTLRLNFLGDVMAHYRQLRHARIPGADTTKASSYDFSTYFKGIQNRLDSADINVANMEFPVGVIPYSGFPLFSAPKSEPEEAIRCGIDVFLAANNHICDKGRRGLDSTVAIYSSMPVHYTGIWRDTTEERLNNPLIVTEKGFRIAFINFTYGLNGFSVPPPYVVGQMDSLQIKSAIQRARDRQADFIIALPHWGLEYHLDYSPEQKKWRNNLYRWGVDMIVGTHPHVPQAVEYVDGRITAYSLGNYISNMSIAYGQVGILLGVTLVRRTDGSIETLPPEVTYLWTGKGGYLEQNYTVVPIEEYLDRPEAFLQRSQYDKMVREYTAIKRKFLQY
ncbi:MAG: CapA family protein [Bacteroidales bacterium]|nr:CapA family protein [Bacteroidales bacterium]